jgi:hypothetical protein
MGTGSQRSRKTNNQRFQNNNERNVHQNDHLRHLERKVEICKPQKHDAKAKLLGHEGGGVLYSWCIPVYTTFGTLVLGVVIGMFAQAYFVPIFFKNGVEMHVSSPAAIPPVEFVKDVGGDNVKVNELSVTKPLQLQGEEKTEEIVPDIDTKQPDPEVVRLLKSESEEESKKTKADKKSETNDETSPVEEKASNIETRIPSERKVEESRKPKTEVKSTEKKTSKDVSAKTVEKNPVDEDEAEEKSKTVVKSEEKSKHFDIEKAVKEFKSSILNQFTPKKIFQDGRRIPPILLHHTKENNSTVQ